MNFLSNPYFIVTIATSVVTFTGAFFMVKFKLNYLLDKTTKMEAKIEELHRKHYENKEKITNDIKSLEDNFENQLLMLKDTKINELYEKYNKANEELTKLKTTIKFMKGKK